MLLQKHVLQNFWVAEEYRAIFCRIPKSASSVFQQLFLKFSGDPDYDADPWHKPGIVSLSKYPLDQAQKLLEDPNWVRAIVLRDPFERLISAYLHKIDADPPYQIGVKGEVVGHYPRDLGSFLDLIANSDGICQGNPHWNPQVGFFPSIDVFNHVIDFRQLRSQGQMFVKKIGAWEEHGASGWGPDRTGEFLATNWMRHATNAEDRLWEFRRYESRVRDIYREDYAMLSQLGFQNQQPSDQNGNPEQTNPASSSSFPSAISAMLSRIKARL